MKPVVSAAQIAAQAYAQRTATPARAAPQPGFSVDSKNAAAKSVAENGLGATRRVSQATDAFKIEISAEALEAASRDGGRRSVPIAPAPEHALDDVAEITFQPVESVDRVAAGSRREAPFAHEGARNGAEEPPRRPGSLLDITI